MYGVCSSFNLALTSYTIKSVSNPMKIQKRGGKPKGQFCNLVYANEECTERIPSNEGVNVMYGVCSSISLAWSSYPVQSSCDAVTALKNIPPKNIVICHTQMKPAPITTVPIFYTSSVTTQQKNTTALVKSTNKKHNKQKSFLTMNRARFASQKKQKSSPSLVLKCTYGI